MTQRFFVVFVALPALLLLTALGCGPGRGDLSGKVTFNGKAVKSGTVSVLGSDGIAKQGSIDKDGAYTVAGVPAGAVKISVTSPDPQDALPKDRKAVPGSKGEAPKVDKTDWFPLPDKYGEFDKSELKFDLKVGANSHDIELK